jgi:O-antigen/teichoic acid export membrane protein
MLKPSGVLKNTAIAFGTNISLKLANVLVFILISRIDGVEQSGIFSLGITYLLVTSAIMLGMDELITRQVSRNRTQGKEYLVLYLPLRILFSLGLYALVVFVVNRLDYPDMTRRVIIYIGLSLFPDGISSVAQALLIAYDRFGMLLYSSVSAGLVKILGTYWAISSGYGAAGVGIIWLLGSAIGAVINLIAVLHYSGGVQSSKSARESLKFNWLQMDIPFLAISLLSTLEFQADVLMLSKMKGAFELGLYSAITTVISGLMLIPQAFRIAVYPYMIRSHRELPSSLDRIYRFSILGLGTIAFPIVVGLGLLSQPILVFLFSDLFSESGAALQIAGVVLIFLFLNVPSSRILLVFEKQKLVVGLLAISLGLNLLLNAILIPGYSIVGAAISRVISEAAYFGMAYYFATRLIGSTHSFRDILIPTIAAALMGLVVWPFKNLALWYPIMVGVLAYPLFIFILLQIFRQDRLLFQDAGKIFGKMLKH